MRKFAVPAVLAAAVLTSAPALAADLKAVYKAAPPPPVSYNPWDVAIGAGVATDYNFRGISQSDRKPSVNAYFEPRYNVTKDFQLYAGVGGYSIDFPNRAAAEIDFYGGFRPTFGALALDFGVWYYYYPGGQCFNAAGPSADCIFNGNLPNGNVIKKDASFLEWYGKAAYTFNDNFNMGVGAFYANDWLNTGAEGTYGNVTAKFTGVALPNGWNWYVSGEYGHYWLGTTDSFYGNTPLPDYSTWNVGIGFTYKAVTIDLRYYDTDLSKADCNVLTGAQTATFDPSNITAINPGGLGSNWCSEAFIAKLSFDTTLSALK